MNKLKRLQRKLYTTGYNAEFITVYNAKGGQLYDSRAILQFPPFPARRLGTR